MAGNGVSRAYVDSAGGMILVGNSSFYLDGFPVAVEGNPVQNHGNSPHNSAVIVNGTPGFLINGIPVCTTGSQASCGHQATGSSSFSVGSSGRGAESRDTPTSPPPYQPSIQITAPTPVPVQNPFFASTWFAPSTFRTGYVRDFSNDDFEQYEYVKPLIWLNTPFHPNGYIQQNTTEYIALVNNPNAEAVYRNEFNAIVNGLNRLPEGMRILCPLYYWQAYLFYYNLPNTWLVGGSTVGLSGGTADDTLYQYGPLKGQLNPKFHDYNTSPHPKPTRYPNFNIQYDPSGNPISVVFTESTEAYDLPDTSDPDYGRRAVGGFIYNRASDNISGVTTHDGINYKWSVASPWGKTAADEIRFDWSMMCAELKNRGAKIDHLAFDAEVSAITSFEMNTPQTPLGITLMRARIVGLANDPRANEPWLGDVSFNDVFGLSPSKIEQVAQPNTQHPQLNPGYIYFDGAIKTLRNSTMNYCFMDVLQEHYPNADMSNYDSFKVDPGDECYDVGGHSMLQANTTGNASSPLLYWAFNYTDPLDHRWEINPSDTTRLQRDGVQPSGTVFINNAWNCFLLDMQTMRAANRANPSAPIRPWIRPRAGIGSGFIPAQVSVDPIPAGGTRFYYELLRHAVLCGTQYFLHFNQFGSVFDSTELNEILIELNQVVGGYTPNTIVKERIRFDSSFVISGARTIAGNNPRKYVWRITPKPNVVLYSQLTGRPLAVDGDGGAWLVTDSPSVPRYTVA